ncbi:hypothetical protein [Tunturiibacter lichenicola]|uniref:hypothetical protein n=1 Tax=Tunturiibacter lichenicola TaxID=2051959 RepID=UPI0021B261F2|nr:hypothetical protein [Edaphobacter lichenicola]
MSRTTPSSTDAPYSSFRGNTASGLILAVALLSSVLPAAAQAGGDMQEKMAALKQSVAANQQRLHQYQWLENTQLTLNGDPKPASQSICRYGPDGQVQKTQISAPPPPPSGGRFKQRIVQKKTGEMQDYMGQVKTLLALYVPPNAQHMQEAFGSGNVSINPSPGSGTTNIVFKDYAQPGDQMTISFNNAAKKISTIHVNTYMDDPKDVVTLAIQFASLPDNTNYVQQSVLNATAKKLVVTTTNSNYQLIGAQ